MAKLTVTERMRRFYGCSATFWAWNFPVVIGLYSFLPDVWQAVSILYLALVSVWANFSTDLGNWITARAAAKQERNVDG